MEVVGKEKRDTAAGVDLPGEGRDTAPEEERRMRGGKGQETGDGTTFRFIYIYILIKKERSIATVSHFCYLV